VQERLAVFETAGALKGGRHIWMLVRLPKTLRAAGEDEIRPYVLLANLHEGKRALRMIPTTVRVGAPTRSTWLSAGPPPLKG
jgi:hypothetical protein